jgi:excisionase family DNA binding protein
MNINTENIANLKQVAEQLELSLDTVRQYVQHGLLRSIKLGNQRFVRLADIADFKQKREARK